MIPCIFIKMTIYHSRPGFNATVSTECCSSSVTKMTITFISDWFPGWTDDNITRSQKTGTSLSRDEEFTDEDCVEMRRLFVHSRNGPVWSDSFSWNDRNCGEKNPFICQHEKRISTLSWLYNIHQCLANVSPNHRVENIIVYGMHYIYVNIIQLRKLYKHDKT